MKDLTIGIYAHRFAKHYHYPLLESIASYVETSFNLVRVIEEGNCHENMARVLERTTSRFLCFIDEDVLLLDKFMLPRLYELVHEPQIAVACPNSFTGSPKDSLVTDYKYVHAKGIKPGEPVLSWCDWVPAYCMMIDLEKVPDLEIDLSIPGQLGMTDVDICFQAVAAGKRCVMDKSVYVYHPAKGSWTKGAFAYDQAPDLDERKLVFPDQMNWCKQKWGRTPHE